MIEQGTEQWHAMRLGKATASRIADIIAKGKGGAESKSRLNYRAELVVERLTQTATEGFTSGAMQWGTEQEPNARIIYETEYGMSVSQAAFIDHPSIEMTGASPDGLVGDDGLVEIKCPNTATHIATLRGGKIDARYLTQMQWQMACTGRAWCDFVSYDPRMPEALQMHVQRVQRDQERIEELEAAVSAFLSEVDEEMKALSQLAEAA